MSGPLDHSPAHITLALLVDAGVGFKVDGVTIVDWMVFLNKPVDRKLLPTSDFEIDKVIVVNDTVGIVHSRRQYDGQFVESHGVQIMIRLNEMEDYVGYSKAKEIQDYLDTSVNRYTVTVNDTEVDTSYLVHSYHRTSDIFRISPVEADPIMGLRYTLNYLMFVTRI